MLRFGRRFLNVRPFGLSALDWQIRRWDVIGTRTRLLKGGEKLLRFRDRGGNSMRGGKTLAIIAAIVAATADVAQAQVPSRFQFQHGQVLQYRVEQVSSATDSLGDYRTTVSTRVEQVKCWQVLNVEPDGTALMQLSLLKLKVSQRLPTGEVWEFDSTSPDLSHPLLRDRLGDYVGKRLAVLRVDPWGRIVEVRSSALVPADHYQVELPFVACLPGRELAVGQTWVRTFRIPVESSNKARNEVEAEQQFQVRGIHNNQIAIAFTTQFRDQPREALARLPLLQYQPQGEAVFDPQLGLVVSARYVSSGIVEGHQGDGSRYEFSSEIRETLIAHDGSR